MKTIRKTTIHLPAPGDELPMTYALCQDDDGAFAIALRNGHTGEQAMFVDITPTRWRPWPSTTCWFGAA